MSELFKNFSYIYENYDGWIMIRMILITFNDLKGEAVLLSHYMSIYPIRNL